MSFEEIKKLISDEIRKTISFLNGGVIETLVNGVSIILEKVFNIQNETITKRDIDLAEGGNLDILGTNFGVTRKSETADLNVILSITIKNEELFNSSKFNKTLNLNDKLFFTDINGKKYKLFNGISFTDNVRSIEVNVNPLDLFENYTLESGNTLRIYQYEDKGENDSDVIEYNNLLEIQNSGDISVSVENEDDASYRQRIRNFNINENHRSSAYIDNVMKDYEQISSYEIIEDYYGANTLLIKIKTLNDKSNTSNVIAEQVRNRLNSVIDYGNKVYVEGEVSKEIQISLKLEFKSGLYFTTEEFEMFKQTFQDYVSSIAKGGAFSFVEIRTKLIERYEKVLNITCEKISFDGVILLITNQNDISLTLGDDYSYFTVENENILVE